MLVIVTRRILSSFDWQQESAGGWSAGATEQEQEQARWWSLLAQSSRSKIQDPGCKIRDASLGDGKGSSVAPDLLAYSTFLPASLPVVHARVNKCIVASGRPQLPRRLALPVQPGSRLLLMFSSRLQFPLVVSNSPSCTWSKTYTQRTTTSTKTRTTTASQLKTSRNHPIHTRPCQSLAPIPLAMRYGRQKEKEKRKIPVNPCSSLWHEKRNLSSLDTRPWFAAYEHRADPAAN